MRPPRTSRPLAALAAAAAVITAACSGGSAGAPTAATPSSSSPAATGPTAAATSAAPSSARPGRPVTTSTTPSRAVGPHLQVAWAHRLDGALYARPVIAAGHVIAATENDTVWALDPPSGRVVWRRHLGPPQPLAGLPCGNIDPLGITGTPAVDPATQTVFVVTETVGAHHTLVALDGRTGAVRWRRDLDVLPDRDRHAEQQRAGLLVTAGRVYVSFGGLFGDCGDYVGYVASVAVDGRGSMTRYVVATRREGGIWAAPGPVVGPGGDIYLAVGNGAATGGGYDGSDAVLRLSPALHRVALFAPSTWPQDNAADLDLGSSSPVPVDGRIVIAGKRGVVYLLPAGLGGIGGELAAVGGCAAYGGGTAVGSTVVLPCTDGLRAYDVTSHALHARWRLPGVAGSPTAAGRVLFTLDRAAQNLLEVAVATGRVRHRVTVGEVTRFARPTVYGALVLVGTTDGVVAVTTGPR